MAESSLSPAHLKTSAGARAGQNLLLSRIALDWTQNALASASGICRATIAQLEAEVGDPRLSTITHLAEALGVSPVVLLFGRQEIAALEFLTRPSPTNAELEPVIINTMTYLAHSGLLRDRLEAARIGIDASRRAGFSQDIHKIGAAIGSAWLPGRGTLLTARFVAGLRPTY